jgi:hypothetical protein
VVAFSFIGIRATDTDINANMQIELSTKSNEVVTETQYMLGTTDHFIPWDILIQFEQRLE